MPISVERSLLIIVVCGLVVFTTRAIPFVLFSGKKEIPEIVKVLEKLKKRSRLFRYENVHLFLFAKKGFTQGCIEEAGKMGNVSLVTYDQIYEYLNDRGITAF